MYQFHADEYMQNLRICCSEFTGRNYVTFWGGNKTKKRKQRKWKDQLLPEAGAGDYKEINRWNTHNF